MFSRAKFFFGTKPAENKVRRLRPMNISSGDAQLTFNLFVGHCQTKNWKEALETMHRLFQDWSTIKASRAGKLDLLNRCLDGLKHPLENIRKILTGGNPRSDGFEVLLLAYNRIIIGILFSLESVSSQKTSTHDLLHFVLGLVYYQQFKYATNKVKKIHFIQLADTQLLSCSIKSLDAVYISIITNIYSSFIQYCCNHDMKVMAEKLCNTLLKLPESKVLECNLATISTLFLSKEYTKLAFLCEERGAKLDYTSLVYNYAVSLCEKNNVEEALPWFEKAAQKKHIGAYNQLGILHTKRGEPDKGVEWFLKAIVLEGCDGVEGQESIVHAARNLYVMIVISERAHKTAFFKTIKNRIPTRDEVNLIIGKSGLGLSSIPADGDIKTTISKRMDKKAASDVVDTDDSKTTDICNKQILSQRVIQRKKLAISKIINEQATHETRKAFINAIKEYLNTITTEIYNLQLFCLVEPFFIFIEKLHLTKDESQQFNDVIKQSFERILKSASENRISVGEKLFFLRLLVTFGIDYQSNSKLKETTENILLDIYDYTQITLIPRLYSYLPNVLERIFLLYYICALGVSDDVFYNATLPLFRRIMLDFSLKEKAIYQQNEKSLSYLTLFVYSLTLGLYSLDSERMRESLVTKNKYEAKFIQLIHFLSKNISFLDERSRSQLNQSAPLIDRLNPNLHKAVQTKLGSYRQTDQKQQDAFVTRSQLQKKVEQKLYKTFKSMCKKGEIKSEYVSGERRLLQPIQGTESTNPPDFTFKQDGQIILIYVDGPCHYAKPPSQSKLNDNSELRPLPKTRLRTANNKLRGLPEVSIPYSEINKLKKDADWKKYLYHIFQKPDTKRPKNQEFSLETFSPKVLCNTPSTY